MVRQQPSGAFVIADLGSTNGSALNGKKLRVKTETPIESGDNILVGQSEILFLDLPEGEHSKRQKINTSQQAETKTVVEATDIFDENSPPNGILLADDDNKPPHASTSSEEVGMPGKGDLKTLCNGVKTVRNKQVSKHPTSTDKPTPSPKKKTQGIVGKSNKTTCPCIARDKNASTAPSNVGSTGSAECSVQSATCNDNEKDEKQNCISLSNEGGDFAQTQCSFVLDDAGDTGAESANVGDHESSPQPETPPSPQPQPLSLSPDALSSSPSLNELSPDAQPDSLAASINSSSSHSISEVCSPASSVVNPLPPENSAAHPILAVQSCPQDKQHKKASSHLENKTSVLTPKQAAEKDNLDGNKHVEEEGQAKRANMRKPTQRCENQKQACSDRSEGEGITNSSSITTTTTTPPTTTSTTSSSSSSSKKRSSSRKRSSSSSSSSSKHSNKRSSSSQGCNGSSAGSSSLSSSSTSGSTSPAHSRNSRSSTRKRGCVKTGGDSKKQQQQYDDDQQQQEQEEQEEGVEEVEQVLVGSWLVMNIQCVRNCAVQVSAPANGVSVWLP
jgi:pSer/pThr/pTyr-binding forkhead associated (FHA) protein